ncbi:probable beta-D-xylosidase 2 [Musa acuminata AAA Group]|uniref:probable beta-D-xylosidase 2 n=1 Tax=Musa acuminata AAA Group TaxID=214697 RepID=UPI0031E145C8
MAPCSLLSILLFLSVAATIAAVSYADDFPPPYDFTHVCDPDRYKKLNLSVAKFAFCDKSLPYRARAKNLVDSLTLQEKVTLLGNQNAAVQRLGLPRYNWWSEALHGVSNFGGGSRFGKNVPGATSFPLPITSAAAFNEQLWKAIGQTVSTEGRAMHNVGMAGLTFWSPNINVVRDPRWGRILETPGEDPFVVGRYAVNFVRGMQDVVGQETAEDPNTRPLKVSACCKHYAAYDLDNWATTGSAVVDRIHFNANVTEQDMVETFLRPFEMCVKEGDVSSVMCSYNQVNAIPTCVDARLLRGTIRNDWELHGYIVSDCDSIDVLLNTQKFLDDTPEDAVAQVLRAGLDLDCGDTYTKYLESATFRGLVKESELDQALINNYVVLLRLGFFDGQPAYDKLTVSDVCSKQHLDLATDAARQGIVLLKNSNGALPLSTKRHKNIAVVGPNSADNSVQIGNYAGVPCKYVTAVDGLRRYASVDHKIGCADVRCQNETFIFPAVRSARNADATVIVAGLNLDIEREDHDRTDLELPGYQNQLIRQVADASKGPVVLVIFSAGGVNVTEFDVSDKISAIVWAGYPGEKGGDALADVLYGSYNPGGRLPLTWYTPEYLLQLPMTSMKLRPVDELGYPGRTYKFYNGTTIYPFGYGLSYTTFSYSVVSTQRYVDKKLAPNSHCTLLRYNQSAYVPPCHAARVDDLDCADDISVTVEVKNTGSLDGSDAVILYSQAPDGILGAPIKQVVGFQRVLVEAGKSSNVTFSLSSCKSLSIVTDSAYVAVPSGRHTFIVGSGDNAVPFAFQVYLRD